MTGVMRAPWLPTTLALALALAACGTPAETICSDAEARIGHRVCVHRIPNRATWDGVAFEATAVDQARTTTYLVPSVPDAPISLPVFVDANAFNDPTSSLHFKFLTESFEELAYLDFERYVELTQDSLRRQWFAGFITEYLLADGTTLFGFTIWDPGIDRFESITCDQFREVHNTLRKRVKVGDIAVVPANGLQQDTLSTCNVPMYDPSAALEYEVYTQSTGCGTLRRYTGIELVNATAQGEFGWQDIIVTPEAPLDIEPVVSGIVTGTRQGELSHLNVRSASRGTPNCFVNNGYDLLAMHEGQLVQLECGTSGATITPISPAQAQACWENVRPAPVDVVPADFTTTELMGLLDLPTNDSAARRAAVGRFGSKGANLATLYQRIDAQLQLQGFLIPMHYYDAFVTSTTWDVDLGGGMETLTFEETIQRFLADPIFTSESVVRRQQLAVLREGMRSATCDVGLVSAIESEILSVYGGDSVMVRFRSSSNAEDALGFNGAGLYDSTSVCSADESDGDIAGPSHCDPTQLDERSICRGLTKVWASLWKMKAYEERDWYGIDHSQVAMGILVNTRTKDELANIVAFTGNPTAEGDGRYLVNAQLGELDVVAAIPGVYPEKDLLTLEAGQVTDIERARSSTQVEPGTWILDDARLQELGAALATIVAVYPVDEALGPGDEVLLDTEWKLRTDGSLAVKQVRPFLR